MKTFIISMLLVLQSLSTFAGNPEAQDGQTCLFTVLHYINPDKPVNDFIRDFKIFTHSNGDIYKDGAKATANQIINYVSTEFDTVNSISVLDGLDRGDVVMSTITILTEDGNSIYHEILFTSYKAKETNNPFKIDLFFYNPATGKQEKINMMEWMKSNPLYFIVVKPNSPLVDWSVNAEAKVKQYLDSNYSSNNTVTLNFKDTGVNAIYLSYTIGYVDGGGKTGAKSNSSYMVEFVISRNGIIRVLHSAYEETLQFMAMESAWHKEWKSLRNQLQNNISNTFC
jgi:hypothetical protein